MIGIQNILNELRKNNVPEEKIEDVKKSYDIASYIHKEQYRQSGEPYIIHPLNVAQNVLNMRVYDTDTICAALLHDTIEDAPEEFHFTKEIIAEEINQTVAELVDGVTKLRRIDFATKEEQTHANTRKIINGLTKDIRIIIVKLADRLHNMKTLEYKKHDKQKAIALETMELYVPIAYAIGAYRLKSELEDLSLRYINPDEYFRIKEKKDNLEEIEKEYLQEMTYKLQEVLKQKHIPSEIIFRAKNVWTAYSKMKKGYKIENIYDLFYLKILVDEIDDCYQALCCVHRNYSPINGRFKDYIFNPRTNLYQALHTTVSDPNGKLTKVKIRTNIMDEIAGYGVSALWRIPDGKTMEETQTSLREKCQFAKKLIEIDGTTENNEEFINEIKNELLSEHVYVVSHTGKQVELPSGSTVTDYACQEYPTQLDKITEIIVNGKEVSFGYVLKNNDRVQVLTIGKIKGENLENYAHLETSKQKIKKMFEQGINNGQKKDIEL